MSLTFGANERILVIGLGRSGVASADVLCARGATVYATDEKPASALVDVRAQIERYGARFVAPDELSALAPQLSAAVLSPGVPLTSHVVRCVQAVDVPVLSEVEVAYRLCRAPIIAVTGTKGKSTTTELIGHLLRSCGKDVRVGGNIGSPLIAQVQGIEADGYVVAEVSSFQLETIRAFRPLVSVILNITPDHLDRYPSMEEYAEAKMRIFANQGVHDMFVGDLDDPLLAALHWRAGTPRLQARQLWYTLGEHHQSATMFLRGGEIIYAPIAGDPRPQTVLARSEIPLVGEHNLRNTMAALLAALALGCDRESLRAAVATFRPPAHRLQPVAEIDGVLYVDDSKATNPDAVLAALRSYRRPIVLIAGGRAKGTAFNELGAAIDARTKAVVLLGEASDEIASTITRTPIVRAATMPEAVSRARELANPGDVVLLSPACASFDLFASAEDRGEQFAAAVRDVEARSHA
ncbi:MAG: UDP-N-acetylmuramoyl-L-alanine--D-glutamate ligase [Vulcanimicrobiaceae bacterium]